MCSLYSEESIFQFLLSLILIFREEDNYSDESDPRTIREFSELGTRGEIEV